MSGEIVVDSTTGKNVSSLLRLTHLIYALHALSLLIGITTAATIVGAFLFGIPSIVAVVLNYVNRPDVRGTFLESHFRWQIRTFWFAALWSMLGVLMFVTVLLIPVSLALFFVLGIWAIYRIGRGWLALKDNKPLPL
jgi:uncharacterized membrane protein